jgi:hypothetical protein
MSSKLGPIEVQCDAPSYAVVRACHRIGLSAPEDVRWCRVRHFLDAATGWSGLFHALTWKKLLSRSETGEKSCNCGGTLPILERVTFTFNTGREESYLMGQCARCRTIFWEEA